LSENTHCLPVFVLQYYLVLLAKKRQRVIPIVVEIIPMIYSFGQAAKDRANSSYANSGGAA
jgi:hypothetical protein